MITNLCRIVFPYILKRNFCTKENCRRENNIRTYESTPKCSTQINIVSFFKRNEYVGHHGLRAIATAENT